MRNIEGAKSGCSVQKKHQFEILSTLAGILFYYNKYLFVHDVKEGFSSKKKSYEN